MWSFPGRVAVVTGAASGIGAQITRDLLAAGACVAAVDVAAPAPALADTHERLTFSGVDVADAAAVEEVIGRAHDRHGRLDLVVNAAGIGLLDRDGSIVEIDLADWRRVLDINLDGAMHTSRAAIPLLEATGGGALVHIASVAGLRNADDPMDAYQVSKAGVMSLSRAIALQYGPRGIRSNTICPGAILTPMIQPLYAADPARAGRMAARTPLRRLGQPADVSDACLFLLSDRASFITGVDLVVDGGWMLSL